MVPMGLLDLDLDAYPIIVCVVYRYRRSQCGCVTEKAKALDQLLLLPVHGWLLFPCLQIMMFSPRGVSSSTSTLLCGPEIPSDDKTRADAEKAAKQKREALVAARNVLQSKYPMDKVHAALKVLTEPAPTEKPLTRTESVPMIAAPPSLEDLMALYQLCGGKRQAVITMLARLWKTTPQAIAPTVESWLVHLPPLKPPSRTQSAPAVLPPAVEQRLKSAVAPRGAGPGATLLSRPEHRILAATAPSNSSKIAMALAGMNVSSAMNHANMNRSLDRSSGSRGTGSSGSLRAQVYTVDRVQQPEFVPVVLTAAELAALPEAAQELDSDEEDLRDTMGLDKLARDFIARSAAMNSKISRMTGATSGMFRSTSGVGRMRF